MRTVITVLAFTTLCFSLGSAERQGRPTSPQSPSRGGTLQTDAISIPQLINYQGKLTDGAGNPITGTRDMTFAIFAESTGGSPIWYETQNNVPINGGLFNVLLGSSVPLTGIPEGPNCFLEVTVVGNIISPRIRLASVAYAYNARKAADIDDGAVTMPKINQSGAGSGQVIKWNGTAWAPANDLVGGSGSVTSVAQATGIVCSPDPITSSGTVAFDQTYGDNRYLNEGQAASGDLTGSYPGPTIAQKGASPGQVLAWNGSAWQPVNNYADVDTAWVRGTPDSILYTVRPLGIARGGVANMAHGSNRFTHVNLGIACTTGTAGQNYEYCAVGGGGRNVAAGQRSVVGGGYQNKATGTNSAVGSGFTNLASGDNSFVSGGNMNTASGSGSVIIGGAGNTASAAQSFVGGGNMNTASGDFSAVLGGSGNNPRGFASVVAGGWGDTVWAGYGGILSGYQNKAGGSSSDSGSTICGGMYNRTFLTGSFVGGGVWDTANGEYAVVVGGRRNKAVSSCAYVGGGLYNVASGAGASVGGGDHNTASGARTTISGGEYNTASAVNAYVGGGSWNAADSERTVVGGGELNVANGRHACVPGGYNNMAQAQYSFAANNNSRVTTAFTSSAAFNGQAASASGQLRCGTLAKTGGSFTIDHPIDPDHKILNHYFVESPDMSNIYSGSVVLDDQGRAEVQLPAYFAALNRNPRVQLTGVGTREVVYVAEDVTGNRFTIGGPARAKVYWQVTGDRQDQSAEVIRALMPVEQPKTGDLAGQMLDDDFLVVTMRQLEQLGLGSNFNFRTAAGRQRYLDLVRKMTSPSAEQRQ